MTPAAATIERELETHRQSLTGYCYRMLGSGFEAEDAVQETLVRAWKAADSFEGRSSLRSWLYRIATNVCVDMLRRPQRRARPMDLGPPVRVEDLSGPGPEGMSWVLPAPDARILATADPADAAAQRDSVRLAFVAALQHLPPRQRAVLILRDVLSWHAGEVADLLDSSVASVNSALQRARTALAELDLDALPDTTDTLDDRQRALLERYVDAFERYDVPAFVALLQEDVEFTMPPYHMWLRGPDQVAQWMLGFGIACRGSRLVPTAANGTAAFGQYRTAPDGGHAPWALVLVEPAGDRVAAVHNFLYPELFPYFGLPARL